MRWKRKPRKTGVISSAWMGRIDVMGNGLNAKQPTYPYSIRTRLEKLERDLQELRKG